jgi:hypothetical protein
MTRWFSTRAGRVAAVALGILALGVALHPAPAAASPTKNFEKDFSPYCTDKDADGYLKNPCAGVAYGNGGGYTVSKVTLESRSNTVDKNPACVDLKLTGKADLKINQYGVFVVPAPCNYKLTIYIAGGNTKGNHVYLTPGCAMALESKGTTQNNNNPDLKSVNWSDDAKKKFKDKEIDYSGDSVDDALWHQAQGSNEKHYCNLTGKEDKNPN